MTEDIIARLYAACNGHPHAKIAWPHRLLHDAIKEIEMLRAVAEMDAVAQGECQPPAVFADPISSSPSMRGSEKLRVEPLSEPMTPDIKGLVEREKK